MFPFTILSCPPSFPPSPPSLSLSIANAKGQIQFIFYCHIIPRPLYSKCSLFQVPDTVTPTSSTTTITTRASTTTKMTIITPITLIYRLTVPYFSRPIVLCKSANFNFDLTFSSKNRAMFEMWKKFHKLVATFWVGIISQDIVPLIATWLVLYISHYMNYYLKEKWFSDTNKKSRVFLKKTDVTNEKVWTLYIKNGSNI